MLSILHPGGYTDSLIINITMIKAVNCLRLELTNEALSPTLHLLCHKNTTGVSQGSHKKQTHPAPISGTAPGQVIY